MIICPWSELGRYAPIIPGLEEAIKVVNSITSLEKATYPCGDGNKVSVAGGPTKAAKDSQLEAHRQYLDVQYMVKGSEVMGWAPLDTLTPSGEFDQEKDVGKYTGECTFVNIQEGWCYVVFPEDAHMPAVHLDQPLNYQKMIIKLKV